MRFFFIVQAVLGLLAFGSYALPTCTYAGTLEKRTSGKQLQVRAAPAPPVGSDVDVAYPVAVEPAGHPETRSSSKPQRVWTEEDYRPGPHASHTWYIHRSNHHNAVTEEV
ncbi:hypothetical protein PspLS_08962 [Pyricularia sp. CBS 133598]|nr:hypothetical protein PspLS_08962 [Pyricularia sp. CBS 133598]